MQSQPWHRNVHRTPRNGFARDRRWEAGRRRRRAFCGSLAASARRSDTCSPAAVAETAGNATGVITGDVTFGVASAAALVQQGSRDIGIELRRDGVKQVERTAALLVRPASLAMLAAADAIEGDRPAAVARVDAALARRCSAPASACTSRSC